MTGAEARARLAERHPDGSPRRRCPMCGDCYDDDYRCYCTRPKPAQDRDPRYKTIRIRREP
jgi:hypothetical protein